LKVTPIQSAYELPVRVYTSCVQKTSIVSSLVQVVREMWMTREVVWRLFLRDFTVQFRQKVLGYLWAFLGPLIGMASFLFLNYSGILNPGALTIPYPLYLFLGMTFWGFFTGVIGVVGGGLLTHGDLVLRTSIPKIALALAGMGNVVYVQLVNLVILMILCGTVGIVPSWWALTVPLMVLPLIALAVGIGLVFAVIGALARDVTAMSTTVLNLMMFLTPVAYVPKFANRYVQNMIMFNPLSHLIEAPRNVFLRGTIEEPTAFVVSSLFGFLILILGIHAFYLTQDKVAERL
jgi:ABC-type polysaccharide/polyol phosphate export permease